MCHCIETWASMKKTLQIYSKVDKLVPWDRNMSFHEKTGWWSTLHINSFSCGKRTSRYIVALSNQKTAGTRQSCWNYVSAGQKDEFILCSTGARFSEIFSQSVIRVVNEISRARAHQCAVIGKWEGESLHQGWVFVFLIEKCKSFPSLLLLSWSITSVHFHLAKGFWMGLPALAPN